MRTSGRYDPPVPAGLLGVNHCDLDAIRDADGVGSDLIVIEPIIRFLEGGTFEDPDRLFERDSMTRHVAQVLLLSTNVTPPMGARGRRMTSFALVGLVFGGGPCPAQPAAAARRSRIRSMGLPYKRQAGPKLLLEIVVPMAADCKPSPEVAPISDFPGPGEACAASMRTLK